MFRRLLRRLFGRSTATALIHPESDADPYMVAILSEVMRTGGMVIGNVADNGDLILNYQDGSATRIPRDLLAPPAEPKETP